MPSVLHETLILLFRNRPALAADLLCDVLRVELPNYREARISSIDLTELKPAEYRADLVIELVDDGPVGGIVLEVQRFKDAAQAATIAAAALEASIALDPDRSRLYCDLILASLSEAARRELHSMDPAKYEYQSEFAKRYIALGKEEGKAEGKAEGRADLIIRQLTLRFGTLPPEVTARIAAATIEELDAIGERLLTERTLEEALGID